MNDDVAIEYIMAGAPAVGRPPPGAPRGPAAAAYDTRYARVDESRARGDDDIRTR